MQRKLVSLLLLAAIASMVLSGIVPTVSRAEKQKPLELPMTVVINEIAWGGTAANDNHEWIELYNKSASDVTLNDWKITSLSPVMEIPLVGIIPAGGYFLIEATEIATNVSSDQLFPDGVTLLDSGMSLSLFDSSTTPLLIDTANSTEGGWPAGQNDGTRCTMERIPGFEFETDLAWASNDEIHKNGTDNGGNLLCGSPKSSNSTLNPTPTSTFTNTPTLTFTPSPTGTRENTPTPSAARALMINEIGWMGTISLDKIPYSNDEWLELYNPTDKAIKLDGWLIRSDDTLFGIDLAGEIPSGGFFLLERNDDNVISNIKADQIFSSILLSNYGDSLRLIDPSGTVIDTANKGGTSWPAGSSITSCSMERSGTSKADVPGSWFTSAGGTYTAKGRDGNLICGSPKAKNWAYSVTPTVTVAASRTPTSTPTGFIPSSIILNEFVVQPREDFNKDGKINTGDSFIELINLSSSRVSLKNWRIDDQLFDSSPYFIGDVSIDANSRLVFYNKDTNVFLSSGSDSVRLFKANQTLVDVFTYTFNPKPGPSWCRFMDGYGPWTFNCVPSPEKANILGVDPGSAGSEIIPVEKCSLTGLPEAIQFAECEAMNMMRFFRAGTASFFEGLPMIIDLGNIKFQIE